VPIADAFPQRRVGTATRSDTGAGEPPPEARSSIIASEWPTILELTDVRSTYRICEDVSRGGVTGCTFESCLGVGPNAGRDDPAAEHEKSRGFKVQKIHWHRETGSDLSSYLREGVQSMSGDQGASFEELLGGRKSIHK
jgi:hypothetical protein